MKIPEMTLRDYFAGQAMQAMIGGTLKGGLMQSVHNIASKLGLTSDNYVARKAYEQADALIAAREVKS